MFYNLDKSIGSRELLLKTYDHISLKRKKHLLILILLMLFSSFAEVISIGSLIPFIGIISNPAKFMNNEYVLILVKMLGLEKSNEMIFFFTFIFLATVLIAGFVRMSLLWFQIKLSHLIGLDFSIKIFNKTLNQTYEYHTNVNSSELLAGITHKASHVVNSILMPILHVISSTIIITVILIFFLFLSFEITFSIILFFSLIYILISVVFKKILYRYSNIISIEQVRVHKILQEGFKGIRYILLGGLQKFFTNIYSEADQPLRNSIANVQAISSLPKIGIETLGIVFLAIVAVLVINSSNNFSETIPFLAAFALGAQKILPLMQHLYNGVSNVRGGYASLKDTIDLLDKKEQFISSQKKPIILKDKIILKDLSFKYKNTKTDILSKINLEIKKGSIIGIVGKTGSGKSTFVDLLLGFLMPTSGKILVDNTILNLGNINNWQKGISYVPQDVSLIDATINENVGFGISIDEIDEVRVKEACKKANILDEILSWRNKFNTSIGENGTRLSGGQKQRIGLARAYYKNQKFLILDEATSALDLKTERKVLKEIEILSKDLTIIIVSHKQTTLEICSHIYEIKNKSIYKIKG